MSWMIVLLTIIVVLQSFLVWRDRDWQSGLGLGLVLAWLIFTLING